MSYFRFGTFPRPPRWNSSSMMGGGGPKPRPREEDEGVIPFIPPDPSGSEDEDEDGEVAMGETHSQRDRQRGGGGSSSVGDRHQGGEEHDNANAVIPQHLLKLKAYRFRPSKNAWKHILTAGIHASPQTERMLVERKGRWTQVRVITWNVDMVTQRAEERLSAALRYIEQVVLQCKEDEETEPEPCVIMLQEVRDVLMPYLLRNPWVRRWFAVTPFTKDKWPEGAHYGNVTLVSRSLPIAESHILHFGLTGMHRTALCVKIRMHVPGTDETAVVAFVNTHLESLPRGARARPKQLEMCARFLMLEGVHGGVVAGDMNAIGPDDETLAKRVGLRDSWRKGDVDAGKTWGFQGQNDGNFPAARLDKILFLGGRGYKVEEPKRFGMGLKTAAEEEPALWVSDHYGLETTLRMLKPRSNSS